MSAEYHTFDPYSDEDPGSDPNSTETLEADEGNHGEKAPASSGRSLTHPPKKLSPETILPSPPSTTGDESAARDTSAKTSSSSDNEECVSATSSDEARPFTQLSNASREKLATLNALQDLVKTLENHNQEIGTQSSVLKVSMNTLTAKLKKTESALTRTEAGRQRDLHAVDGLGKLLGKSMSKDRHSGKLAAFIPSSEDAAAGTPVGQAGPLEACMPSWIGGSWLRAGSDVLMPAEKALWAGELQQALVETAIARKNSALDSEEHQHVRLLEAYIMRNSGQFDRGLKKIKLVVAKAELGGWWDLYQKAQFHRGLCYQLKGGFPEALWCYSAANGAAGHDEAIRRLFDWSSNARNNLPLDHPDKWLGYDFFEPMDKEDLDLLD